MFGLVPTSVKIKAGLRGLGLTSDHVNAINRLLQRVKGTDLGSILLPDSMTDIESIAKLVIESDGSFLDEIPLSVFTGIGSILSTPETRRVVASSIWAAAQKLNDDEIKALQQVMMTLSGSQIFSDRKEFDDEIDYISDALLSTLYKWIEARKQDSYMYDPESPMLYDTNADLVVRCPYCKEVYVPNH